MALRSLERGYGGVVQSLAVTIALVTSPVDGEIDRQTVVGTLWNREPEAFVTYLDEAEVEGNDRENHQTDGRPSDLVTDIVDEVGAEFVVMGRVFVASLKGSSERARRVRYCVVWHRGGAAGSSADRFVVVSGDGDHGGARRVVLLEVGPPRRGIAQVGALPRVLNGEK